MLLKQEEMVNLLGFVSAVDESTFSALVSIWGSRMVCAGLSQNKLQCVCSW